mmetsp:Transcript_14676/g.40543  ORF Transcript_14676/g.40543 Transcript_14676/m.40543 type:complete len:240 (-) Transcript_14676:809-1528(-)
MAQRPNWACHRSSTTVATATPRPPRTASARSCRPSRTPPRSSRSPWDDFGALSVITIASRACNRRWSDTAVPRIRRILPIPPTRTSWIMQNPSALSSIPTSWTTASSCTCSSSSTRRPIRVGAARSTVPPSSCIRRSSGVLPSGPCACAAKPWPRWLLWRMDRTSTVPRSTIKSIWTRCSCRQAGRQTGRQVLHHTYSTIRLRRREHSHVKIMHSAMDKKIGETGDGRGKGNKSPPIPN